MGKGANITLLVNSQPNINIVVPTSIVKDFVPRKTENNVRRLSYKGSF